MTFSSSSHAPFQSFSISYFQNLRIQYIALNQSLYHPNPSSFILSHLYNCHLINHQHIQITKTYMFSLINPYFSTNQEIPKESMAVNVTQLTTISRTEILKYLFKNGKITEEMVSYTVVSSNPRNFYLDVMMAKNYSLFYDEEQLALQQVANTKRLIKLPLNFQIVTPDAEFKIDCQSEIITLNHFNILRKIGEGTYAQIFLIQRKFDRQLFCMKRINKAECKQKGNLLMIKNQYEILQYPSKYKVKLYYQFEDTKYTYFIEQFCVHGDLYGVIKTNKKLDESSKLTLTQKYLIWIQIAFGIVSLHEKGLIYRDLKPQNILLNENGEVKICDFGFTSRIEPNQKMKQLCGSYQYLAPEVIKKQGYNKSVDIYCLGLLFYQLLVGSNPFQGVTPQTISQMKSKNINFDKKSFSNTVKDLLKKMLKEKPQERIGYDESLQIFKHQFFKQNEDLVMKIVNNKILIKNIKYIEPAKLNERDQLNEKAGFIFSSQPFNYLKPFFDVTENVGPKLNFTK